ncbi:MAG: antitoxin component YwqK of YwqJK toxin-antitoxin module, partial [Bacteroidia bacterium]
FFKNEIPEGKWETFSEEGTKTAELNYQEGKRHGEFRVWDEFVSTYTEMHYSNGDVVVANKWVKQVEFASTEE